MLDHRNHTWRGARTAITCLAVLSACASGGGEQGASFTDTIPPQAGVVRDGLEDDLASQSSTTSLSANWSGFVDDSGLVTAYEWAIGTTPGGREVQNWLAVGSATNATNDALVLEVGRSYFCSVRAYDAAGNGGAVATSDGVLVAASEGEPVAPPNEMQASSITQFGITWQFAESERVGQFANGDWWVVGPIDVVVISPRTQTLDGRVLNGSMVNPGPDEILSGNTGYDSELDLVPALNVATGIDDASPLTLAAGSSLISTISWTSPTPPESGSKSPLQTAAVLTVLASAAPPGTFRPPYAGNDKTLRHHEADLDYTLLASLHATAGMPDLQATTAGLQRVWLDHRSGWGSRFLHPIDNLPDYGRDFTSLYGTGALMLHLDLPNTEKRDLLVRLVQIGIDFFGNVQNGGYWDGVGGHGSGRKFPILFAGKMLDDPQMLALGTTHPSGYFGANHANNRSQFGEDCQTFYVAQTSPSVINFGYGGYEPSDVGKAEWGNAHTTYPQNDNHDWNHDAYRRCCTANAWVAQTLVCHIMNLEVAWNHPAFFDYMERYLAIETPGTWTHSWEPWQGSMWSEYRAEF